MRNACCTSCCITSFHWSFCCCWWNYLFTHCSHTPSKRQLVAGSVVASWMNCQRVRPPGSQRQQHPPNTNNGNNNALYRICNIMLHECPTKLCVCGCVWNWVRNGGRVNVSWCGLASNSVTVFVVACGAHWFLPAMTATKYCGNTKCNIVVVVAYAGVCLQSSPMVRCLICQTVGNTHSCTYVLSVGLKLRLPLAICNIRELCYCHLYDSGKGENALFMLFARLLLHQFALARCGRPRFFAATLDFFVVPGLAGDCKINCNCNTHNAQAKLSEATTVLVLAMAVADAIVAFCCWQWQYINGR